MNKTTNNSRSNTWKQYGLVVFRIIIGWHFLYEGIIKLVNPDWSAQDYLLNSRSFISAFFHELASNPVSMEIVDFLNIWGLILIGLSLFMGIFARLAVYAGILLLSFYYLAYPPFSGYNFGISQEGHYLIVDKSLIEIVALIILSLFPQTLKIGIQNLFLKIKPNRHWSLLPKKQKKQVVVAENGSEPESHRPNSRRSMLKNLTFLPFAGAFTWAYIHAKKNSEIDAISGSTITLTRHSLNEIEGEMPMGVLAKGKPPVSRLIMGTNHLSGNAHARDLKYASSLFKAYNTNKKVIETYMLAEQAGINLFYATPLLEQYKKLYGGKFQTWRNVSPTKKDIYGVVDKVIDMGVDYIFIQGAACDRRAYEGDTEVVAKCIEYIQRQGYPAGLGAHTIQAMTIAKDACLQAGVEPDFYYKTMHHDKYWSAHPKENRKPFLWSANISEDHNEFHDNMWCLFPEETIEFVQKVKKPVVGFKVLAGGAIVPEEGFQWAFDNGADFIEVGMFDFQIVQNVIQTIKSVEKAQTRTRPWYG
jgi:uncharacterized membrane protein YphA (DoxX/SURF4 family)